MVAALNYPVPGVPASFPIIIGSTPWPTGMFNQSVTQLLLTDHYVAYTDVVLDSVSDAGVAELKFLEIGFYWCTKTLSTEVRQGIPYTEEIDAVAETIRGSSQSLNFGWNTNFYPCYVAGTCNATLGGLEVELEPPRPRPARRYTVNVWSSLLASALVFASMYDVVLIDSMRGIVASSGGGLGQAFTASILGDFMTSSVPRLTNSLATSETFPAT